MDYKELVKILREHAKHDGDCDICPYYDAEDRGYGTCSKELTAQAADAIEELIAALTASNEVIAKQSQQLEEYRKYDSFLAAHGCFDNIEPLKEDE